jgi:S1-C subfamily serine protease
MKYIITAINVLYSKKVKYFLYRIYIIMLYATQNSLVLAILAIAIALATPAITESALASKSISWSTQSHSLNTIFKQVENSVVQITSKISINNSTMNSCLQNATALGSGFVYDKQGHIITNNHVLGGTKIVDVIFVDGNRYTAKVVGTDAYSDIAVVQIDNITQSLKPLLIGNSSKLEVGDPVIALATHLALATL